MYACDALSCPPCDTGGEPNPYLSRLPTRPLAKGSTDDDRQWGSVEHAIDKEIRCANTPPPADKWIARDKIPCWGCNL